jgi:spermidine synthase
MTADEVRRTVTARGELVLRRRADGHQELRANGVFVMDTLEHSSERALAARALALHPGPRLRVLVGGLGLGYTLGEVLVDPRVEHCTVVEIEPDLVAWLREGVVPHAGPLLADPRTRVVVADVADTVRDLEPGSQDLVLLDVDNGPEHLVHEGNAGLYDEAGLRRLCRVLAPGGVAVVWSATPSPALEARMRTVFGEVEVVEVPVPGHGRVGSYLLYAGRA